LPLRIGSGSRGKGIFSLTFTKRQNMNFVIMQRLIFNQNKKFRIWGSRNPQGTEGTVCLMTAPNFNKEPRWFMRPPGFFYFVPQASLRSDDLNCRDN
jgi:hypothetical protein